MDEAVRRDPRSLWPGVRLLLADRGAGRRRVLGRSGHHPRLAATRVWPVTTQTDYFTAHVLLTPGFGQTSTVHTPTALGDIDLESDGPVPAPGLETQVQVREEITDLFGSTRLDVAISSPSPPSCRPRSAPPWVGWRGASSLAPWGRRRHARGWAGAAAYLTYRPSSLTAYRATSLLATVQQNSGLLEAITGQAQAAGPYLQNLFALSPALQSEFAPEESGGLVIDTGDLINFGLVEEGSWPASTPPSRTSACRTSSCAATTTPPPPGTRRSWTGWGRSPTWSCWSRTRANTSRPRSTGSRSPASTTCASSTSAARTSAPPRSRSRTASSRPPRAARPRTS